VSGKAARGRKLGPVLEPRPGNDQTYLKMTKFAAHRDTYVASRGGLASPIAQR